MARTLQFPPAPAPHPAPRARAPPLRRRRHGCEGVCAARLAGYLPTGLLVMGMLAVLPGALFPSAARGVNAVTDVVEDMGGAASKVFTSGANVTDSAARFVTAITDGTLTLGETAWRGFDLRNISAACRAGRLFLDPDEDIPELLREQARLGSLRVPTRWLDTIIGVFQATDESRPMSDGHFHEFVPGGSFGAVSVWVKWLKTGHVGIAWRSASISFTPRWANPAWEIAGYDFGSVADEMAAMLQRVVYEAMPDPDLALSIDELGDTPGLPAATIPKLWRRASRWWRWTRKCFMARFTAAGEEEGFSTTSPLSSTAPVETPATAGVPSPSLSTPSTEAPATSSTTPWFPTSSVRHKPTKVVFAF